MNLLGSRRAPVLPGLKLTVRAHRNLAALLPRIEPGDLVVIDQLDLDAETARALVDRKPAAVLNAAEFISGRYANLGPRVLADNKVMLLQGRRDQILSLRDGLTLRLHEETLYDGPLVVLDVVEISADRIRAEMETARSGLAVQLDSFAHAASEFVRREEPLLLHGTGAPALQTKLADRVVVVVGPGARAEELKKLRRFLRATKPALIGVDAGIDRLAERGLRADVAVLSGGSVVSDKALRRSREVVLAEPGQTIQRQVEKLNLPASVIASSAAPADIGLLLAHHGGARLAVPVGSPATIEEFIDRDRTNQASNVLTRLRLGARVVDGSAVPQLQRRRRHLGKAALAVAVVAAVVVVALTPSGGRWWDDLRDRLPDSLGGTGVFASQKAALEQRDQQLATLQDDAKSVTAYSQATAPAVVGGTLTGRSVTLVVLPGADPASVTALRTLVGQAGARITGEATVTAGATAPEKAGIVDALTSQMLTQSVDVKVAPTATGPQRLGALIARALAVPSSARVPQAAYDATAVSIASGLETAGVLTSKVTARAGLTLIVTGSPNGTETDGLLATIVRAFGASVPTVVAGPDTSGNVLALLREQPTNPFSTVDGAGSVDGQVASVLALAAQTRGVVGGYGQAGANGPVPPRS